VHFGIIRAWEDEKELASEGGGNPGKSAVLGGKWVKKEGVIHSQTADTKPER
jgi:hypothetical protein